MNPISFSLLNKLSQLESAGYSQSSHELDATKQTVEKFLASSKKVLLLLTEDSEATRSYCQQLAIVRLQNYQTDALLPLYLPLGSLQHPREQLMQEGMSYYQLSSEEQAQFQQHSLLLLLDGYEQIKQPAFHNLYVTNKLEQYPYIKKIIITCKAQHVAHLANYRIYFMPFRQKLPQSSFFQELKVDAPAVDAKLTATYYNHNDWAELVKLAPNTEIKTPDWYLKHPLNQKLITASPADVLAHVDIIQKDEANNSASKAFKLKQALFYFLKHSKYDRRVAIGAANAITILNAARTPFSEMDLAGIQISGANLDHAIMQRTNLAGANLAQVSFSRAYLREADLSNANMQEVTFGEKPYLPGYGQAVSYITYHPGNNWLLVASQLNDSESAIFITDYATKQQIFGSPLRGYQGEIVGLYLNQAGTHLYTASNENWPRKTGIFKVWDVKSQQYPQLINKDFINTHYEMKAFTVSADERYIATVGYQAARLYDLATGKFIRGRDINGKIYLNSVCFSSDGQSLAVVSDYHSPELTVFKLNLKVANEDELPSPDESVSDLQAVQYSHNGMWLAVSSSAGFVVVYNTANWQAQRITLAEFECDELEFTADDSLLCVSLWHRDLNLSYINTYSLPELKQQQRFKIPESSTQRMSYIASNNCLASVGWDGTIRFWQLGLANKVFTVEDMPIAHFAILQGDMLVEVRGNILHYRQLNTGLLAGQLALAQKANCIASSGDNTLFAVGGMLPNTNGQGYIEVWDNIKKTLLFSLPCHRFSVTAVGFSPDGRYLASASKDQTIALIELASRKVIPKVVEHQDQVWSLKFSHDSKLLFSGSSQKLICYSLEHQRVVWTNSNLYAPCLSIDLSPDQQFVVINSAVGQTNCFSLWSIASGQQVYAFYGHTDEVRAVAFHPNGQYIASASKDCTIKFWLMPSAQAQEEFKVWGNTTSHYKKQYLLSIDDFNGPIEYLTFAGEHTLIACSTDKGISNWLVRLNQESAACSYSLHYISGMPVLDCRDAKIDYIRGLSTDNHKLLQQRSGNTPQEKKEDAERNYLNELENSSSCQETSGGIDCEDNEVMAEVQGWNNFPSMR